MNRLANLLVYERDGTWAEAWRRALRRAAAVPAVRVVELRSLDDCRESLEEAPTCVVALDAAAAPIDRVLDFVVEIERRYPRAVVVVWLPPHLAEHAALVRELGAAHVLSALREVPSAVSLVCRHVARHVSDLVDPLADVLANLPWSE